MSRGWGMVALALLAASPGAGQHRARPTPPPAPRSPFPVGERLVYEALFGPIRLGRGEMTAVGIDTIRGHPALHIMFQLEGGGYFYPIRNRMDSWIALSDTASRRFTQDFEERGKKRHAYYDIVPDSGYYREKGVDSLRPTVKQPLDDAAFFYFVRTVPLEAGKRYEIARYFRPDRNPVILDVKSRDTLDTPAGRFPSLLLQPIIKGRGILAEASNARMWLSDDERRIMVQLKSKFPFGVITLRLIRIEAAEPAEKR
ncbi:MAG: DUF3108 domain-containing protein [Gemmatimonadetes bacterium]|nr:DUF3108 domain-containing protein [Gemmatimonadota bacterium]